MNKRMNPTMKVVRVLNILIWTISGIGLVKQRGFLVEIFNVPQMDLWKKQKKENTIQSISEEC